MFLQYVKGTHQVSGEDYLCVRGMLQEGDIILRGHDNYLSKFIVPGKYSHSEQCGYNDSFEATSKTVDVAIVKK